MIDLKLSRLAFSVYIGIICAFFANHSTAQEYPNKLIRFVVPTTPGSSNDIAARTVGQEMSRILGHPIIVENKPGADQVIGMEHVAKYAPADGYTMVIVSVVGAALLPLINKNLRFDPLKDLVPVISLGEVKNVLSSSSEFPWKTFLELVTYAKGNPGKISYGSSTPSLLYPMVLILRDLGIDASYVPYSTGAQYLLAIARAEVHMGMTSATGSLNLGRRVRILAVTGEKRTPPFLEVPTFAELGHPNIRGLSLSLSVRSVTPKAIFDKLHAAASRALQQPEVKTVFERNTMEVTNDTSEAAARRLAEEVKFFVDIAQKIEIPSQ